MNLIRKYSIYILLILLLFFTLAPLFQQGFITMHDDEQVGRLYELDQSLKAGHFPVRISQNLGFGYGYPLFNFYPSFIYYVAEVFVLLGVGYIASIELMIGLGFILAAFFMYLFSKEYLGKYGGVVAAVAYSYAPYHALDVYVRGALPEFWSFVFIPAIFWGFKKLADTEESRYVVLTGIFIASIIFTHNLVAMMSGIFITIYLLYLILQTKERKKYIMQIVISGLLGLMLSAAFWIPSFFERNTTMIQLLTQGTADYNQHFVYLRQLWNSPWGYGGSLNGLEDGISFEIGKLHIVGVILAILMSIWFFIKKNQLWKILLLFGVLFGIATFMITYYSDFIWDKLGFFAYIQFPWRFLLFSVFASSFLLGSIVVLFKSKKLQIIFTAIIVFVIIFSYKDFFKPDEYLTEVTDASYTSNDVIRWKTSIMAYEYVPAGFVTKSVNGHIKIDVTEKDVASSSYRVLKGNIAVREEIVKPHYKEFSIDGSGGILRINQFYYPGWKIFIDNIEVSYSINNKFRLLDVTIPSGKHTVEAVFHDTPMRQLGNMLTAASILLILLYIILILREKRQKRAYEKSKNPKNK